MVVAQTNEQVDDLVAPARAGGARAARSGGCRRSDYAAVARG